VSRALNLFNELVINLNMFPSVMFPPPPGATQPIIIIVSHHSSREHKTLTKFRHLTRFLASTLASFHVLPWSLISSKIVLRHVVRGLPRDLVP
jgi:hypothetical protein